MEDATIRAALRWQECKIMCQAARAAGMNVTPERVNRSYKRFREWYEGRLALGYLLKVTGLKLVESESQHDRNSGAGRGRS
jgi:hypothetical protein